MSQSRAYKKYKRSKRHSYVNKSTQTERERPVNPTATINGSVIIKVTDYTQLDDDGQSSVEETSMSDASSHCSANSCTKRRSKALVTVTNCASQTERGWRNSIGVAYESGSDSDDTDHMNTTSYDYLEGEPLVTSLADLPLSDDEDNPQLHTPEIRSNEEKLAKFL